MTSEELERRELRLQVEWLKDGISAIQKLLENPAEKDVWTKEYYTIEECAERKGGCALQTLKTQRWLLPGCGNPKFSAYVGGRLCFPREVVQRWVKISDADYLDYAKECGITVIPDRYKRMTAKAKGLV